MNTSYLRLMQNPAMMDALNSSSRSAADAANRSQEYAKIFSRNSDLVGDINLLQKNFSGYAETPLMSTQYFNASVASFVSSFAGFMSIEQDFDHPTGLFYWFDVLGVTDLRTVIPNLGPDNYQDIQTMGSFSLEVTPTAVAAYSSLIGRKIIPASVRVKIDNGAGEKYELIDNGQGQFMSVAGKIVASSINYLNGKVDFTLATPLAGTATESILIVGKEDVTGTPCNTIGASNAHANDKRFMAKMQQIPLTTVPDMLIAEYNIASLGALKKSTSSDMATFLFTKLRELYTKCINGTLVNTLENGYIGNTMADLDLTTTGLGQFHDFRSRLDLFDAYLINVETALAEKAAKGVNVSAYLAGPRAANQFQKGQAIGRWERNTKMTYINDLLGWYNGVPVLRSTDVVEASGEGTFYAIIKTEDGQMAPLARGIFMPLTDTPTVGSYNNPTQMASGIYYQEGTRYLAPELVQKVTFKVGI